MNLLRIILKYLQIILFKLNMNNLNNNDVVCTNDNEIEYYEINNETVIDHDIHYNEQMELFENMVDHLWNNIILNEIEYGNTLKKLSVCDKDKFYDYMFKNSNIINMLNKKN